MVLLNRQGDIFLVNGEDPIDPRKAPWWEIPGGAIDYGETSADAATRECIEETGIEPDEVGPCIWQQWVEFDFGGYHFNNFDSIHVAWCDGGEYQPRHLEALEAAAFLGARWWSLEELLASEEPTLPARLREFLPDVVAGRLPDQPIDISPYPVDWR